MTEKCQRPTSGVCVREVSISYKVKENDWRTTGTNSRCPFWGGVHLIVFGKRSPYRESKKIAEEQQGPALGVHLREVFAL